jgi:hypothetical protein
MNRAPKASCADDVVVNRVVVDPEASQLLEISHKDNPDTTTWAFASSEGPA